ncbi:MAG: hypothetical protein IJP32_05225 [Clostridia bacterium]|nr:hypothetical protein [Clostridia bacterium]
MLKSEEIREKADRILEETGLFRELSKYGEVHPVGSYRMDIMAWNDIDIDVRNDGMNLDKLYALTRYVLDVFHPVWYEAKEEVTDEGKTVWFHGWEAVIDGELWNFDIWFFDTETIAKAEKFCDGISAKLAAEPEKKTVIAQIKRDLIERGMYSFEQYHSMDVYRAVLDLGMTSADEMIRDYRK